MIILVYYRLSSKWMLIMGMLSHFQEHSLERSEDTPREETVYGVESDETNMGNIDWGVLRNVVFSLLLYYICEFWPMFVKFV